MEIIKDSIVDTFVDGVKLLPFLFVAFLIIEAIEHKLSKKSKQMIEKSGKFGPLFGGILGLFPQCGFSVMATNLYITRIISLGTLISIYLSTSDEMLPILISENVELSTIVTILGIKFFVGMTSGFIIDLVYRKKESTKPVYEICEHDHCHCKSNIIKSTLIHTLSTLVFIMIVSLVLNLVIGFLGEENIQNSILNNKIFGPLLSSLLGLVPNCAASVMITELYLSDALSLGATISGLLTGSGVAILVLFKSNNDMKNNILILSLIYTIGVVSGFVIELIGMMF